MGSPRERSSVLVFITGAIAAVDALVRVLPDVLRLGDAIVIPVGVLLGSRIVLNYDVIGWALGWLLLWTAVFVTVPGAFPRSLLKRANGLVARGGLATGAVLVGMYFELATAVALNLFETSWPKPPFPVPLWTFPAALISLLVLFWLTWSLPGSAWIPRTRFLPYTGITVTEDGRIAVTEHALTIKTDLGTGRVLSRWFLLVLLAGLVLSMVSTLFPLPEFIFIGLMGREIYLRVAGGGTASGVRTDLAERYVSSLGAIWVGPRGVLGVVYTVVPLPVVLFFDNLYLDGIGNTSEVVTSPTTLLFIAATLGVATLGVVTSSVRLTERLTAEFETTSGGSGQLLAEVPSQLTDRLPRIPGFMLVPAALLITYESVRSHPTSPRIPFTLTVSMPELAVALGAAALCLLTVWRPGWIPNPWRGVRTYYAAALSASLFTALIAAYTVGTSGALVEGMTGVPPPTVPTIDFAYKSFIGFLSPLIGYELFRIDPHATDYSTTVSRLWAETKRAIGGVVVASVVGVIAASVLSAIGFVRIAEAAFVTLSTPVWWGLYVRLALLPVYGFGAVFNG